MDALVGQKFLSNLVVFRATRLGAQSIGLRRRLEVRQRSRDSSNHAPAAVLVTSLRLQSRREAQARYGLMWALDLFQGDRS